MTASKPTREREEMLYFLNQARDATIASLGALQRCKSQFERLITLVEHGGIKHLEDDAETLDDAMMRELREARAKLT